jgi:hypothetical protein
MVNAKLMEALKLFNIIYLHYVYVVFLRAYVKVEIFVTLRVKTYSSENTARENSDLALLT